MSAGPARFWLTAKAVSCLMLAAQLQGRSITTIEGLARAGGRLAPCPVQETFIERGAIQCGFCTPGMVLAAIDLLKRNPDPDREEIRRGLSGNLCRCTGYVKIVGAVAAAAARGETQRLPGKEKNRCESSLAAGLSGRTVAGSGYPPRSFRLRRGDRSSGTDPQRTAASDLVDLPRSSR